MYLVGQRRCSPRRPGFDLQRQESYTLIEILITIAVISIMAAMAIPNFLQAQIRSKVAHAVTNQSMIAAALDTYYVDYEQYPFNNLLVETIVPGFKGGPVPPLMPDVFASSPFTAREEIPGPIFLEARETTGAVPPFVMYRSYDTFRAVERTTRTVVREISYSSEIPLRAHRWMLCRQCGTVNAQTETRCAGCGRRLEPPELRMIYNQSLNGEVLSVLTTPIAYLPTEVNKDAFRRSYVGRFTTPRTFLYVNYLQIHPEGVAIPLVGRRVHYAIISYGPDTRPNYIHSYPAPHVSIYDPTNGTISPGDVINFGH